MRLLNFYVDQVFPVIEATGLSPISPSILAAPEGAGTAATEALFNRASVVIVDVGDGTGWYDASIAKARNPSVDLIVVTTVEATRVSLDVADHRVVMRQADPIGTADEFVRRLADTLRPVAERLEFQLPHEPYRLLELGSAGPAVVLAFTQLEGVLRKRFGVSSRQKRTPNTVPEMLRALANEESIAPPVLEELLVAWRLRNELVHGTSTISRTRAAPIVDLVMQTVDWLETD